MLIDFRGNGDMSAALIKQYKKTLISITRTMARDNETTLTVQGEDDMLFFFQRSPTSLR
jgi:hypothetical protein